MYIRSLQLENLRCFAAANLTFQYPGRVAAAGEPPVPTLDNVNLILGNNGAGKSTILKGAALAAIAPILSNSGFFAYSLVRREFSAESPTSPIMAKAQARVILTPQDTGKKASTEQTLFARLERQGDEDVLIDTTARKEPWTAMASKESPAFLVLGYGPTRRMAPRTEFISTRSRQGHLRYQRVQSLFDEELTLVQLAHWLPEFRNSGRRSQVVHLLDELLGSLYRFKGEYKGGEYYVEKDGISIPIAALSDGYRGFIGWVSDLLYHVCFWSKSGSKLREIEGIVLVDEIDAHLHPDWQRSVIQTLSRTFRKIQFIFTSHSPLITGSLEWPNIWVMRDGAPTQLPDEPINGLSADQVLLSPYFGVRATRADEKISRLQELDRRAQRGDAAAAQDFMRELSTGSEALKYGATAGAPPQPKIGAHIAQLLDLDEEAASLAAPSLPFPLSKPDRAAKPVPKPKPKPRRKPASTSKRKLK